MSAKVNTQIIVFIILILISLSLAGSGFYLLQKERMKNIELQDKVTELTTQQKIAQAKLDESKRIISDLKLTLDENKVQIDGLNTELSQEKASREEALANREQLRTELEQQKSLRSDLENKLNQAQDELRKSQVRLKELDSQRLKLESKIKDLEGETQNIELGNIVVGSDNATLQVGGAPAAPAVTPAVSGKTNAAVAVSGREGKVLVVNKDYNFIVINLGNKDGVGMGDVFSVYHSDKYIGDVKVEKVHDSMAAAGLVSGEAKGKVYEGDKVIQKVK